MKEWPKALEINYPGRVNMSSSYQGVGYFGNIDTLGNLQAGQIPIQPYLSQPGLQAPVALFGTVTYESERILGTQSDSYFFSFIKDLGYPSTIEDMIVNFRVYLYAQRPDLISGLTGTLANKMAVAKAWLQTNAPNELDYTWSEPSSPFGNIYNSILTDFTNAMGFVTTDRMVFAAGSSTPVLFSSLSLSEQFAYTSNLLNQTYKDFVSKFVFQKPVPPDIEDNFNGTPLPPGTDRTLAWMDGFSKYLQTTVAIDGNNLLGYETFYDAFFTNNPNLLSESLDPPPSELFDDFFAGFLKKIYGDPLAGKVGTAGYFAPTLFYDKWTEEVLQYYYANISGSTSLAPSGSNAGSEKTRVMNRIFSLLVLMIESLQKVAAAQSDRLLVYSKWQKAYTDLQNSIKFVTENDTRFHSDLSGQSSKRLDFNNASTAYTEMIKARKQTIGDDAKNLQTQVNQSTDAVNQQGSMATSILQELSSILSALHSR